MAVTRREVRERVMQALYALEQGGGDAREVLDTVLLPGLEEAEPASRRFGERLFLLSLDYRDEADALVGHQVKNWEVERIAIVDHVLLRLAITEFLAFDDIPPKVTINEAIEIAKRYSTHKSGQFVNGVLDGVLARLNELGRLKKAGRGLVASTPGQTGKSPAARARAKAAIEEPPEAKPVPGKKRPRIAASPARAYGASSPGYEARTGADSTDSRGPETRGPETSNSSAPDPASDGPPQGSRPESDRPSGEA